MPLPDISLLEALPMELLSTIYNNLPLLDRVNLRGTSRKLRDLVDSEGLMPSILDRVLVDFTRSKLVAYHDNTRFRVIGNAQMDFQKLRRTSSDLIVEFHIDSSLMQWIPSFLRNIERMQTRNTKHLPNLRIIIDHRLPQTFLDQLLSDKLEISEILLGTTIDRLWKSLPERFYPLLKKAKSLLDSAFVLPSTLLTQISERHLPILHCTVTVEDAVHFMQKFANDPLFNMWRWSFSIQGSLTTFMQFLTTLLPHEDRHLVYRSSYLLMKGDAAVAVDMQSVKIEFVGPDNWTEEHTEMLAIEI